MPRKKSTMPDGAAITSTSYIKFFVEGSGNGLDKLSRKSNLIMNLRDMSKDERKKAAVIIIEDELSLAAIEFERHGAKGPSFAIDHLASAINTEDYCKVKHDPRIDNPLIRAAWEARDPRVVDGTTRKEALKKSKAELADRNRSGKAT